MLENLQSHSEGAIKVGDPAREDNCAASNVCVNDIEVVIGSKEVDTLDISLVCAMPVGKLLSCERNPSLQYWQGGFAFEIDRDGQATIGVRFSNCTSSN